MVKLVLLYISEKFTVNLKDLLKTWKSYPSFNLAILPKTLILMDAKSLSNTFSIHGHVQFAKFNGSQSARIMKNAKYKGC